MSDLFSDRLPIATIFEPNGPTGPVQYIRLHPSTIDVIADAVAAKLRKSDADVSPEPDVVEWCEHAPDCGFMYGGRHIFGVDACGLPVKR